MDMMEIVRLGPAAGGAIEFALEMAKQIEKSHIENFGISMFAGMPNKFLVIARTHAEAEIWAKDNGVHRHYWWYGHNSRSVHGMRDCTIVYLPGWERLRDAIEMRDYLHSLILSGQMRLWERQS